MNRATLLFPMHIAQPHDTLLSIAELCVQEDKHLSVMLFSKPIPTPMMTEGDAASAEIWAQQMAEATLKLKEQGRELELKLQKVGVRFDVTIELDGYRFADDIIGSHALYADIAIVQRPLREKGSIDSFNTSVYNGVLFNAGKPLLLFNDSPPKTLKFETVLVAWDAKRASSRAITEALTLLKNAGEVHVLIVDSDKQAAQGSDQIDWELPAYLARHNIKVSIDARESMGERISSVILKRAMEVGADLIVTGSYGRSRLRERIFGGTTKELLNDCPVPLLMAH